MQETTGGEHCSWQHWQEMHLALSSAIYSNGKKQPRRLSQQQWKRFYSPARIPAGEALKMMGIFLISPKIMPGLSLQIRQSFTLSYLLE